MHSAEDVHRHVSEHILPNRQVWVARDPVSGFLALDPKTQTITALYCAETGRGIGRALLEQARKASDHLDAWAFQANTGARRFYAREGFKEVRATNGDNVEGLPDVLLRWESAA
jgi:GNAT superfamily N-acetyltransferase